MEDPRREKQKVISHSRQLTATPLPALPIQIPAIGNKSLEDDPMKLRLPEHEMTTNFLDVRKDDRAISLTVPPLHEDPDGTRVFLPVPQIFVREDRRTDLFAEDVTCADN